MTDDEYGAFRAKVNEDLRLKQVEMSHAYALGDMKRWWFEQETAKLQFFDHNDKLAIEADVIVIGTFSPALSSWKWAWSNSSLRREIRQRALPLKRLKAVTGFDLFEDKEAFSIEGEAMARELAAMAVHQLGALGCYRAPLIDSPHTFLAITTMRSEGLRVNVCV